MASDSTEATSVRPTRTVSLRLGDEAFAALEYVSQLFPTKYDGISSVLRDYSVTQALELHQRATQLAGALV